MTGRVALDAVFPFARDHLSYPDLLEEGLEPHKVREILLWGSEDHNYRSDITNTVDLKIDALGCHKSQVGNPISARTQEWVRYWSQELAKDEDFELAEAFHRIEVRW